MAAEIHLADATMRTTSSRVWQSGETWYAPAQYSVAAPYLSLTERSFSRRRSGASRGMGRRLPGFAVSAATLIYFHGGGYFTGSPRAPRPITAFFASGASTYLYLSID